MIYKCMKDSLNQLSKLLLAKYAKNNIRVNSVRYSPLPPLKAQTNNFKFIENLFKRTQLGPIEIQEECLRIIKFLLSKEASYINRSEIAFDSGRTLS